MRGRACNTFVTSQRGAQALCCQHHCFTSPNMRTSTVQHTLPETLAGSRAAARPAFADISAASAKTLQLQAMADNSASARAMQTLQDSAAAHPIQRYALDNGAKVSQNNMFRTSPDNKNAFVEQGAIAHIKGALDGEDNSRITVETGAEQAFGDHHFVRIVPVLKEAHAASAIEDQLDLYRDAWNYIGRYDTDENEGDEDENDVDVEGEYESGEETEYQSDGMARFESFYDDEKALTGQDSLQIRLPLDCHATSEQLQKGVTNHAIPNPAVGKNHFIHLDNQIQGTLLSAIKGWNFHYASIIAKDHTEANDDNLSLEVGAEGWVGEVMNQITLRVAEDRDHANLAKYAQLLTSTIFGRSLGRFDIYGTQTAVQTFEYTTYSKLLHHMLDQVLVQLDLIPHLLAETSDSTGNLKTITVRIGLLSQKIDELKGLDPKNREAVSAGIRAYVNEFPLNDPEERVDEDDSSESGQLTDEMQAVLAVYLFNSMANQAAVSTDTVETVDEEKEGFIPQADAVTSLGHTEDDVQDELDSNLSYSAQYRLKVLEILRTARAAFGARREKMLGLGDDFRPLVDAVAPVDQAFATMMEDEPPQPADDERTWTQLYYGILREKLEAIKTGLPVP